MLFSLAMVTLKKLMASAVPESTKRSLKYAVNVFEGGESHE